MRLFTAIELHPDVLDNAVALQDRLSEHMGGVKWTAPEKIHLTLKFLGDCPEERLDEIQSITELCTEEHSPFSLRFQSVGQFPERGTPSVIWVGVQDLSDDGQLQSCFGFLDKHMTEVGVDRDNRDFVPHVTIGRVKQEDQLGAFREAFEQEQHTVLGEQEVEKLVLMESELHPDGSEYSVRCRSSLAGGG
jgi:2'-5' RNA ligase